MTIRELTDCEIGDWLRLFAEAEKPLIMGGGEFSPPTREATAALHGEYNQPRRMYRRMHGLRND